MKLLDLLTGKGKSAKASDRESANRQGLSLNSIYQVTKEFPIGAQLGYYPEYKKDIKLDSLVVGYIINNNVIYSNNDILYSPSKVSSALELVTPEARLNIDHVVSFHIILPHITRTTIDYASPKSLTTDRKSSEKKINDFMRGSTITLFSRIPSTKGISHIDTVVSKNMVLKDGHYANSKLVLLEPILDSFECVDLRRLPRVDTEIPAEIQLPKDRTRYACVIRDFSEKFIRIELTGNKELQRTLTAKHQVFLVILPEIAGQQIVINGTVHRSRANYTIISMDSLLKKGAFQKLDQLDEFFIKATLLNHPNSKRG